jgi:hypothetical protein
MSFEIYWTTRNVERHIRVDAPTQTEAVWRFTTMYPRRKITKVRDVTTLVRARW